MKPPTYEEAYQVLVLQAADEGRGPILFGDSLQHARIAALPFLVGNKLPDVYLEFPLAGAPFLDVTLLYGEMEPGTRVDSPAAGEHSAMFDWFAQAKENYENITCGFELDTKEDPLPAAAIHFQPRKHEKLVRPFCEAVGEPQRADLYLDLASRMPKTWQLSFFGMFRGRPNTPLRVCGYLDNNEIETCANNPKHLTSIFNEIGFSAYDDAMLEQIAQLMNAAIDQVDFQFDIYDDGRIGPIFAMDIHFGIEQPELVRKNFAYGPASKVMKLLEDWNAVDSRWKLGIDATFARSLPVELPNGEVGSYAFTLMPQWLKARWINGVIQPSKLYHLASAGLIDKTGNAPTKHKKQKGQPQITG